MLSCRPVTEKQVSSMRRYFPTLLPYDHEPASDKAPCYGTLCMGKAHGKLIVCRFCKEAGVAAVRGETEGYDFNYSTAFKHLGRCSALSADQQDALIKAFKAADKTYLKQKRLRQLADAPVPSPLRSSSSESSGAPTSLSRPTFGNGEQPKGWLSLQWPSPQIPLEFPFKQVPARASAISSDELPTALRLSFDGASRVLNIGQTRSSSQSSGSQEVAIRAAIDTTEERPAGGPTSTSSRKRSAELSEDSAKAPNDSKRARGQCTTYVDSHAGK